MKTLERLLPWLVGGGSTPLAAGWETASEGRLTAFRTELAREGSLRDLEVDGRRTSVAEPGRGKPLVLLHGVGGSIYDWRHLLRPLSGDRRVIAVDLLGAGESEKPEGEDYSVVAQARRVRAVLDRLGVERASFAGDSFGGGVALRP
jgi:pimeloyl-ACP methyl ester carboxylesterase